MYFGRLVDVKTFYSFKRFKGIVPFRFFFKIK